MQASDAYHRAWMAQHPEWNDVLPAGAVQAQAAHAAPQQAQQQLQALLGQAEQASNPGQGQAQGQKGGGTQGALRRQLQAPIQVPVYFHIILNTTGHGDVPDSVVAQQMTVMNGAYAAAGIAFVLISTDRTVSNAWFTAAKLSTDEDNMKKTLRKGTADDLNIYVNSIAGGLLGWGTWPWAYDDVSKGVPIGKYRDGAVISNRAMPGGASTSYNQGDIMVHEVGHWFGLYHSFQGGCTDVNGDYINDTPKQGTESRGCTLTQDTCTGDGLLDPVQNYMDYSSDSCRDRFSTGQMARMNSQWATYRAGK